MIVHRGCKVCECGTRHPKAAPCPTCPLCGCHANDHPRVASRVQWCRAVTRTWPSAPLVALLGSQERLLDCLGMSNGSMVAELSDSQADRWAIRCGYHPNQVWPGWSDAGLTERDRLFIESGGWRQSWLWQQEQADEVAS